MKPLPNLPTSLSPWRCSSCNVLMYDIERKKGTNYPVPGAPVPHEGVPGYEKLCTLCLELYRILSGRPYWSILHNQWRNLIKGNLRSGSDVT